MLQERRADEQADGDAVAATTDAGATSVRRFSRPNVRGSCPCSPSEYARRPKPEIDVVTAESRRARR